MVFSKKGELSSLQIVSTIIVIAGFVILLLFLPVVQELFGEGGETDRELCHLSVISRATTADLAQKAVPLRCNTEKVCISESGRKDACKQFAGEENVRGVKINLEKPEEAAKTIEKESAEAMLSCWQMMGEGKLDIWNRNLGIETQEPMCVVCSRIAIDETLWNNEEFQSNVMNNVDVNDFMENERPSERVAETYLQLFTDVGVKGVPSRESLSDEENAEIEKSDKNLVDSQIGSKEASSQMAVVFAQIKVQKTAWQAAFDTGSFGFALYGGSLLTPAGRLTATPIGLTASLVAIGGTSVLAGINTAESRAIAAGYCGDFTSTDKSPEGCSVVQFANWDASVINSACSGGIEGNL